MSGEIRDLDLEPVERFKPITLEDLLGGKEQARRIGEMPRDPKKGSGMIMQESRPSITSGVLDFGIFLTKGAGDNITPLESNAHYLVVSLSSLVTGKRKEINPIVVTGTAVKESDLVTGKREEINPIVVTGVSAVKESERAAVRGSMRKITMLATGDIRPVPAQIVRQSEDGNWVEAEPDHVVSLDEAVKLMGLQEDIGKLIDDLRGDPSKGFVSAVFEQLWKIVGEANIDVVELLELARERPASDMEAEAAGKMLKKVLVYRVFSPFEQGVKTIGFQQK